jgi:hypothetical protein
MAHGEDVNGAPGVVRPVGDDIGRSGDNQLPGAAHRPWAAKGRMVAQVFHQGFDPLEDHHGGAGIVAQNVLKDTDQVVPSLGRP